MKLNRVMRFYRSTVNLIDLDVGGSKGLFRIPTMALNVWCFFRDLMSFQPASDVRLVRTVNNLHGTRSGSGLFERECYSDGNILPVVPNDIVLKRRTAFRQEVVAGP
jgi:hypothetical protein